MSQEDADAGHEYTLDRTRYGDDWRVDDEGHLHIGSGGSGCVDSVTITYTEPEK